MNQLRRPLIAGNWKMHHGGASGRRARRRRRARLAPSLPHVDLVIAPPFTALAACAHECDGSRVEIAGAEPLPEGHGRVHRRDQRADARSRQAAAGSSSATASVASSSARPTQSSPRRSPRRSAARLVPIVCVGETLAEREGGQTLEVVERQVRAFLGTIAESEIGVAIAYEPVWAIGTGKTAGPAEAQEVHAGHPQVARPEDRSAGVEDAHPLWRLREARQRARSARLPRRRRSPRRRSEPGCGILRCHRSRRRGAWPC